MVTKDCFFTKSTLLLIRDWDGLQIAMRRGLMLCRPQAKLSHGDQKRNWRWSALLCAAVVLLPSIKAVAGESKTVATMEEVVVTATRDVAPVLEVPANVTVINALEIEESGAGNIVDLLASRANIHVKTYNGNPSQAFIDLRGFGENGFGKTLVLLDGRRLNRIDMASINWLQIPLQMIERIEVVRGTHSALYGDGAVAGVINIISKKGETENRVSGSFMVGEHGVHGERVGVVGSADRLSYALNGEYQADDGWRDRSSYKAWGGGANISYDVSDAIGVSVGGSYNKTEFEMPGALTEAEMSVSRTQIQPARSWLPPAWGGWPATSPAHTADESENEYVNAYGLLEGSFGDAGDLELNVVFGNKEILTDMPSWYSPSQYNRVDIDTFGFTPKYILSTDRFGWRGKIIAGVDYYKESLAVDQYLDPARSQHAWDSEVNKDSLGWYLRNEYSPVDKTIIGVGYRNERVSYEGRKTQVLGAPSGTPFAKTEKTHQEEAFAVDFTWLPADTMKLYAKLATLYRYPFAEEQVSFYGWADGFNLSLNPETGRSCEVGGNYSPLKGLNLGLTVFQVTMEDEIVWDNGLNMNVNLDETSHRGVEISFAYERPEVFALQADYAYHLAEFENGLNRGKELPMVPNHQVSASLDILLPHALHVVPEMQYVGSSFLGNDYDNSSDELESYTVFNLFLRYAAAWRGHDYKAFVGVKNIFDSAHESIGFENDPNDGAAPANTFYPSAGREFVAGLSCAF